MTAIPSLVAVAAVALAAGGVSAQTAAPAKTVKAPNVAVIPGKPCPTMAGCYMKDYTRDVTKTPTGTYRLSGAHVALLIKVPHSGGVSWSVFRFNKMTGTMNWKPSDIAASTLDASVDTKSIETPVPGFAENIEGPEFLNSAKFPTATFVSTGAKQTSATTGVLTGNFTLLGVTKPVNFDVTFIGGTPSAANPMNLGFNALGRIKRSDFGMTSSIGPVGDDVLIELDVEAAPGAAPRGGGPPMTRPLKTDLRGPRTCKMRALAPLSIFAVALLAGASVLAQTPGTLPKAKTPLVQNGGRVGYPAPEAPAERPPVGPGVIHDAAKTEAGVYTLDDRHAALIGKITHNLSSWSVFRLGAVKGSLTWNPRHPELSKLQISADPSSITSVDKNFQEELKDKYFLNVDQFPQITFVSTSARVTGPGKGRVTGNLTFLGVTRPATFDVLFNGASKKGERTALGFNARGAIDVSRFGWAGVPATGDMLRLELDTEFDRGPRPPPPPGGVPG